MYAGLIDASGKEITTPGYHRVSLDDIRFKISPPRASEEVLTFLNIDYVVFPQMEHSVYGVKVVLFIEADLDERIDMEITGDLVDIPAYSQAVYNLGQMTFSLKRDHASTI